MKNPPDPEPSPTPAAVDRDESAPAPENEATTKKRKRSKRSEPPREHAELDAEGRERPRFLLAFPEHPELAELTRAFEAGNYAYVREHAPELARRADDDEVRRAALELAERIKPDPLIKYLLVLSIALLAYLVIHAYASHGH